MGMLRCGIVCLVVWSLLCSGTVQAALFGDFTIQDEVELGQKINQVVRSQFDVLKDPAVTSYVRGVSQRIENELPSQPFRISVTVVRDSSMNAFAAPAGYMFVHTGLLLHLQSEAQLAGVLAHELAHVTQRHIARNIERSQLINLGTLAGMLAGVFLGGDSEGGEALAMGSMAGGRAAALKYSREDEREADHIGLQYLRQAGYSGKGMVEAFEIIQKRKWLSGHSIPTYLSTHPGVGERITSLEQRVQAPKPDQAEASSRFARVRTLIRAKYTDPQSALQSLNQSDGVTDSCLLALGRGIIFMRLQQMSKAQAAFERALSCAPQDPLVQREAGQFFYQQGSLNRAQDLLKAALKRKRKDTLAMWWYAKALAESGERGQSVEILQRILRYDQENAKAHAYLGRLQGQAGYIFQAHLHLAYAVLYGANGGDLSFHVQKADSLADSPQAREKVQALNEAVAQHKEMEKLAP